VPGKIGATFSPRGPWARDLDKDLGAIAAWGARVVVTLLEAQIHTKSEAPATIET
jgi:hypothetical protein